jgi:DNA-binding GntR family transcriptional regulator
MDCLASKRNLKFLGGTVTRIRRDSITDQVYDILHRDIEAGRFEPGARILEDELARDLGVSKTPLRLALYQLRQDGVVRIEARRGIYLASPKGGEVVELIALREVLEGLAARLAALDDDRHRYADKLESCVRGFSEGNLPRQRAAYATADHCFHSSLVEASGSRELIKALRSINIRLHLHRIGGTRTKRHDLRPIHRQHLSIIRAIRAGDSSRAEVLARAHVRHQLSLTLLMQADVVEPDTAAAKYAARAAHPPARPAVKWSAVQGTGPNGQRVRRRGR